MFQKESKYFYVLAISVGLILTICITIILALFFKTHVVLNLSFDGSEKSFLFDSITSLVGILTVIFVALAFKQQTKQMKISTADKKLERCLLLMADVEKLEKNIAIKINLKNNTAPIISEGSIAIDDYILWLQKEPSHIGLIHDYINFKKDLFIYLYNSSITIFYITTFKGQFNEHYQILNAKFFFNSSRLYSQVKEMLKYESDIIASNTVNNNTAKGIIEQLKKIKNGIEKQKTK